MTRKEYIEKADSVVYHALGAGEDYFGGRLRLETYKAWLLGCIESCYKLTVCDDIDDDDDTWGIACNAVMLLSNICNDIVRGEIPPSHGHSYMRSIEQIIKLLELLEKTQGENNG